MQSEYDELYDLYVDEMDDSDLYDDNGKLTPKGLALWLDDEGGVFSFIQGRGVSDLVEAGVSELIARQCELAMELLKRELERIGATL